MNILHSKKAKQRQMEPVNTKETKSIKIDNTELRDKIKEGLDLTFKKLLEEKRKNDGEFVFYENDKIVRIKARDMKD